VYSFSLYTFCVYILWHWPKHVVVSTINRTQDSCVLTYPTPSLITCMKCLKLKSFVREKNNFTNRERLFLNKIKFIHIFQLNWTNLEGNTVVVFRSLLFSLEGRAWQEPEPSHVTGMALAHCILGKFLEVVCHCFPPPFDVPTLAAKCLRPQRRERS